MFKSSFVYLLAQRMKGPRTGMFPLSQVTSFMPQDLKYRFNLVVSPQEKIIILPLLRDGCGRLDNIFRSLCKSRYSSCSKFGGLHESRSGLSLLVDFRSRESVFLPSEVEKESRNNVFVGFLERLEDVSLAGRVGLTSILVGGKLRNMPKPVKEKSTN